MNYSGFCFACMYVCMHVYQNTLLADKVEAETTTLVTEPFTIGQEYPDN